MRRSDALSALGIVGECNAMSSSSEALDLHRRYAGKMQTMPKCPISGPADFAVWYTPGVAEPCRAIQRSPEAAYDLTNKGNLVAVVSDGSRVLGLGDIGPVAGLPVMEGKCLLFKYLGGVDAVALCLATRTAEELVQAVTWLAPSFGAINLEDIAQPKCFRVLDSLRTGLDIPIWHDDQQGTATVVLAGLINALRLTGRDFQNVRIAMVGFGAANVATYRLLIAYGLAPQQIVACDSKGLLHKDRRDIEEVQTSYPMKWEACSRSTTNGRTGGIDEALRGADVCLAFSKPGPAIIQPEWIKGMSKRAIVFACANPVPEIWPDAALAAGAEIVATGRSDFANQVNNSLIFPGMFRGILDVRASAITDRMAIAAAHALAVSAGAIIPH
ncbi:NADP-dependent malic enzyme [Dongia mobilis]|uniref:NAD(P)-dependent malic enzyme n=1 Tax=Dongia sp. TaxID=1977262 RepID=UPI0026EEA5D2